MDAGIAAIIAAATSTLIGGLVGFLSSFFTTHQVHKQTVSRETLPRQLDSIQFIHLVLFKALAGIPQADDVWDKFITHCLWLPPYERGLCFEFLQNRDSNEKLISAQKAIIELSDRLIKGDTK